VADSRVGLVLLTLNAESWWPQWNRGIAAQRLRCDRALVLDSESTDGTPALARAAGFEVHTVRRAEFDHGAVRRWAVELLSDTDLIVFFTQDAIPCDEDTLHNLVRAFDDPAVALAYGRQIPRPRAGALETFPRLYNYPPVSEVRSLAAGAARGFRAAFCSNSFAAYRREALLGVGGFPPRIIMGEDMYAAARLLIAGWHLAYCADAVVVHSHDYTAGAQFRRYFDMGVFLARERWIREALGRGNGEGRRYAVSELRYALAHHRSDVARSAVHSLSKFAGYQLGLREAALPRAIKRRLSLHRGFWRSEADDSPQ
jgi:rhamnosyltransferase